MVASHRLGPLGLGDLLDEVIRLYRAGFRSFVAAMVLPSLAGALFAVVVGDSTPPPAAGAMQAERLAAVGSGLARAMLLVSVDSVVYMVAAGAVVCMTAWLWRDQRPNLRRAYAGSLERFWAQLGLVALVWLILIGLILACAFLLILDVIVGWLILIVGLIVWFARSRWRRAWLRWLIILAAPMGLVTYVVVQQMAASPALMLEGLGPSAALGRSRRLIRDHWWRVFGLYVLMFLIGMVLLYIPTILISFVAYLVALEQGGSPSLGTLILKGTLARIGGVMGSSLFSALFTITPTLIYFDLRNRKEGYDLQLQAERLAAEGAPSLP